MPLLVDLDRVDAAILPLEIVVSDGVLERLVELADAMPEDVGEADQQRRLNVALAEFINELFEVDMKRWILCGMNGDVALLAHREIALAPLLNPVKRLGVLCGPGPARFGLSAGDGRGVMG